MNMLEAFEESYLESRLVEFGKKNTTNKAVEGAWHSITNAHSASTSGKETLKPGMGNMRKTGEISTPVKSKSLPGRSAPAAASAASSTPSAASHVAHHDTGGVAKAPAEVPRRAKLPAAPVAASEGPRTVKLPHPAPSAAASVAEHTAPAAEKMAAKGMGKMAKRGVAGLAVAGAAYGAKKIHDAMSTPKQESEGRGLEFNMYRDPYVAKLLEGAEEAIMGAAKTGLAAIKTGVPKLSTVAKTVGAGATIGAGVGVGKRVSNTISGDSPRQPKQESDQPTHALQSHLLAAQIPSTPFCVLPPAPETSDPMTAMWDLVNQRRQHMTMGF